MKKIKIFLLMCVIIFVNQINIFAMTDNKIFIDDVTNQYAGTKEATPLINNLKFTDVPNGYWAKESIIKAGALNMVKGYNNRFRPSENVSNQEAIAFALRVIGLENQAQAEGVRLKEQAGSNNPLEIWSVGYLSLARNNNLITNQQYNQAISLNQESLPTTAFKRNKPATREQVITWLITALNIILETPLQENNQQNIYNYKDWQSADVVHIPNIEIALSNGIISGDNNKNINPKGSLTRAEMAQILTNLDNIYNNIVGLTKKIGTVAGIKDDQTTMTGKQAIKRDVYIRTDGGRVEILSHYLEQNNNANNINTDAVVYNVDAKGLTSLREGNKIEYLVNDTNKTVHFVSVKNSVISNQEINGKLTNIGFNDNTIQVTNNANKTFNYSTIDGIVGVDKNGEYIYISEKKRYGNEIPRGSMINVILKNNLVETINYVGEPTLIKDLRGIVIENNEQYGYLTILDNNGNEVTKYYFEDSIEVEKQPYYDTSDDIGYLDQVFPNFEYDPRDTSISNIEVGDIVFINSQKDDPKYIERISASPNYFMKYGNVIQSTNNIDVTNITVQFDNGQISTYDVPSSTFVSRSGQPSSPMDIVAGDWVKLLVNDAILAPGETIESVKEILIEDSGHLIGDIVKGQIGNIDNIQNTISLQHSYTLGKTGWENYMQVRKLNLNNNDIMYYYNNERISLAFVKSRLNRMNGEVYVAMEENFSGDIVKKITFRTGRDELLAPDMVVTTNGVNNFATTSSGIITTDEGTIVRKNGKLVSPSNININDYARVSLNGDGKAGIVDIYDMPIRDTVSIARARIKSIEDNRNFTVNSISMLTGNEWEYAPIERKFTIDEQTIYITKDGIKNINEFIGYTENTSIDKAITIVFDGDKATHIIENDYPTKIVKGTIYQTEGGIKLNNATYLKENKTWETTSNKDATINLTTEQNVLVIKDNKVSNTNSLQKGDAIRVFTVKLPEDIVSNMTIDAVIIFVEN